jgi:hypothetical protein
MLRSLGINLSSNPFGPGPVGLGVDGTEGALRELSYVSLKRCPGARGVYYDNEQRACALIVSPAEGKYVARDKVTATNSLAAALLLRHAVNQATGQDGSTIEYSEPSPADTAYACEVRALFCRLASQAAEARLPHAKRSFTDPTEQMFYNCYVFLRIAGGYVLLARARVVEHIKAARILRLTPVGVRPRPLSCGPEPKFVSVLAAGRILALQERMGCRLEEGEIEEAEEKEVAEIEKGESEEREIKEGQIEQGKLKEGETPCRSLTDSRWAGKTDKRRERREQRRRRRWGRHDHPKDA